MAIVMQMAMEKTACPVCGADLGQPCHFGTPCAARVIAAKLPADVAAIMFVPASKEASDAVPGV